ncbi:hypothetical protein QKW51_08995 [Xenophilus aerolatus]|nr:hypothetical protein [Xenophilus aerolatus]
MSADASAPLPIATVLLAVIPEAGNAGRLALVPIATLSEPTVLKPAKYPVATLFEPTVLAPEKYPENVFALPRKPLPAKPPTAVLLSPEPD